MRGNLYSRKRTGRLCAVPAAALLLLSFTACTGSNPSVVAASGLVKTKDGRPCEGAFIVFHPQEKERINDPKPVATADAMGKFVLTTFASQDGARPGEYGITVVWPGAASSESQFSLSGESGNSGPDQLKGQYGDPRSPVLHFTIPDSGATDMIFEVDG